MRLIYTSGALLQDAYKNDDSIVLAFFTLCMPVYFPATAGKSWYLQISCKSY